MSYQHYFLMTLLSFLHYHLKKLLSFLHFLSHIYSFSISSDWCKSVFFLHYLYQKKISFSNTSYRKYLFSFITFEIIYFLSPWPLGETYCFLLHVNTLSCLFTFYKCFITYIYPIFQTWILEYAKIPWLTYPLTLLVTLLIHPSMQKPRLFSTTFPFSCFTLNSLLILVSQ